MGILAPGILFKSQVLKEEFWPLDFPRDLFKMKRVAAFFSNTSKEENLCLCPLPMECPVLRTFSLAVNKSSGGKIWCNEVCKKPLSEPG